MFAAFLPEPYRYTAMLWAFGFFNVRMIWWLRPRVLHLNEESVTIKIPLSRRSRNHLNSMYFGALAVGADCTGGFYAYHLIQQSEKKIALVFKDLHSTFHKRAHDDVLFICKDGVKIRELVERAIASSERVEEKVTIEGYTSGDNEHVASFTLTLSLKDKSS